MDMKRGYSFPITAMDISEEVPRKGIYFCYKILKKLLFCN